MIETTQWLAQITLKSNVSESTCKQLWKLLLELLGNRLALGLSTTVEGLLTLSTQKELEYIALLSSGERLLVPPRIKLVATSPSRSQAAGSITKLLTESTEATSEAVTSFMQTIATLFQEHMLKGHELHLELLGDFTPYDGDKGFIFKPAQELINKVNKPFKSFSITPLPEGKVWNDLEESVIADEELLETSLALTVLWQEDPTTSSEEVAKEKEATKTIISLSVPKEEATTSKEGIHSTPENRENATTPPPLPVPPPLPIILEGGKVGNLSEGSVTPTNSTIPPSQVDQSIKNDKEETSSSSKKYRKWVYLLFAIVVIVSAGVGLSKWRQSSQSTPSTTPLPRKKEIPSTPMDSIQEASNVVDTTTLPVSAPLLEPIEEQYIEIEKGKRLVDYARKTYGNKRFWIYIYMANRTIIKNPDNIPIGTKLRLPPAQEYGINATDTLSLQRADSLIRAYRNGEL